MTLRSPLAAEAPAVSAAGVSVALSEAGFSPGASAERSWRSEAEEAGAASSISSKSMNFEGTSSGPSWEGALFYHISC